MPEETPLADPEDVFKDVPSEILDGYTISFNMSVASMDGGTPNLNSRASNQDLRSIEDFVDLEKLRILFFTCLDDEDYVDGLSKKWTNESQGQKYESGKHDVFLFEAKTRWVSLLSTVEASDASYQVTTPVFTLGSEEETQQYDWEYIREALIKRPFKIAILVNRPEKIHYSDYDSNATPDGSGYFEFGNKGPYWARIESDAGKELYKLAKSHDFSDIPDNEWTTKKNELKKANTPAAIINDLHHCQWDAVYQYKNSTSNSGVKNNNFYDYILSNPVHTAIEDNKDEKTWRKNGMPNAMGAVSDWTMWMTEPEYKAKGGEMVKNTDYDAASDKVFMTQHGSSTKTNFYKLPSAEQGIPMYGVQRFDALENWKEGSPIHLSTGIAGDESAGDWKKITLLRSLARIELIIPTNIGKITNVTFEYSNVYGRCEPLDVATPTDILWNPTHTADCEWHNIYKYGPIINADYPQSGDTEETSFLKRHAWFYGAWKPWWDFNGKLNNKENYFDDAAKSRNGGKEMPYPRIFNPCVQRNGTARLEFIRTDDDRDTYYHYVIYTGERNINDPSKFYQTSNDALYRLRSELAYFKFTVDGTNTYCFAINPYNPNTQIRNTYLGTTENLAGYKTVMPTTSNTWDESTCEWNWPILRNHAYVFRVTGANKKTDNDGINVMVISAENRTAPGIIYY